MIRTRSAAMLGVVALALAGCSVFGEKTVPRSELEDGVRRLLEEQVGQPIDSVSCDDDLAGEVDASVRCTLTAEDGSTIGLTVTATDVDGNDVRYEVQVDETASPPAT
ncbi:DUF4333 domain-containing protein, partial [Jiangella asiatica]